jgi:tetratricopeptide (TPR) repeat protein
VQLDPLAFMHRHVQALLQYFAGRYEEALATKMRASTLGPPDFVPNQGLLALVLLGLGRKAEAVTMAQAVRAAVHVNHRWTADADAIWTLKQCGLDAEAATFAEEALRRLPAVSYARGFTLGALGRFDDALEHLTHTPVIARRSLYWAPLWDPFREDPRFQQLLAKLGCAEEYKVARETLARLLKEQAGKK